MIKAYYESMWVVSPFLPLHREINYETFKTMREFKKQRQYHNYTFIEKYDRKNNFIKRVIL